MIMNTSSNAISARVRSAKMLISCGQPAFNVRWGLLLISALLSGLAVAGDSIQSRDTLIWNGADCIHWLAYTLMAFLLCLAGEWTLHHLQNPRDASYDSDSYRLTFASGWRMLLTLTVIILLCWLPYLIYLYPGVMWYDTANQLLQWNHLPNLFTSGQLTDHHPVFDTMIFGLFVQLGNVLGSGDYGVFLYSIIQSVVTACSLAYCLQFMRQIGASHRLLMVSLAFFSLFPIFPMYSSAMVKDSLFLPVFVIFVIQCAGLVRDKDGGIFRFRSWIGLLITSLLLSLTKKTGMYIVLVVCVLLLCCIAGRMRLLFASVVVITIAVMAVFLPKVVFPVLNIQPGGKQEMLAVPFQQSARLMRNHGGEIKPEQRDVIQRTLGEDVGERYVVGSSDAVKGFTWDERKNRYLTQYLKVWFEGLTQYPLTYVEAYMGLEAGWVTMPHASQRNVDQKLMPVYAEGANHAFFEGYKQIGFSGTGLADAHQSQARGARLERSVLWLEQTPVGMLLFSRALWSTWITVLLVYECIRRHREGGWRKLLCISPMVIAFCSLWISPVSASIEGMRYMTPLIYTAPLAFTLLVVPNKGNARLSCDGENAL